MTHDVPVMPPRSTFDWLRDWWPILVAIAAGIWTIWTWYDANAGERERRNELQLVEAKKPFLLKKTDLFFEVIKSAGQLTIVEPGTTEWNGARDRVVAARWGELEMIGNPDTRQALRRVAWQIRQAESNPEDGATRHKLRWMVECLADQLRFALEISWSGRRQDGNIMSKSYTDQELPSGCYQGNEPPPPATPKSAR